eukprot:356348-Chlamydomonas_euryale.AAC.14
MCLASPGRPCGHASFLFAHALHGGSTHHPRPWRRRWRRADPKASPLAGLPASMAVVGSGGGNWDGDDSGGGHWGRCVEWEVQTARQLFVQNAQ